MSHFSTGLGVSPQSRALLEQKATPLSANNETGLKYQWSILLVASIVATLPVWLPMYPQMSDLPQHAAQVSLLRNLHNPSFAFADMFHVNWFTPYLFGYMLVYFFSSFVGIVTACKIVVALAQAAMPLSTALVMKETGSEPYWALLTVPALYGFSYQWGFLNYLVAAPLGFLFFWVAIRHWKKPSVLGAIALAVFAVCLFFCHVVICAFFGFVACAYVLCESRSLRQTVVRCFPMAAVVPIAIAWFVRTLAHPAAHRPMVWDLGWFNTIDGYYELLALWRDPVHAGFGRISGFFPRLLGVRPSFAYTLFGIATFLLPVLAGARYSKRLSSWTPLTLCGLVLLFAPHTVFGTDLTYQRFTMFSLGLYCLTLLPAAKNADWQRYRRIQVLTLLFVLAWIGVVSVRTLRFDAARKGFEGVIARMEPGQRTLSMIFDRDDQVSIAPIFMHFPSWYAAQKDGITDPSVAMMHPQLVVYKPGRTPKAVLWGFDWFPKLFDWKTYHGEQYRYFIVRAPEDVKPYYFTDPTCRVTLRYAEKGWWLYERDASCNAATAGGGRQSGK